LARSTVTVVGMARRFFRAPASPYSGFGANLIVDGVTVSMDGYKYRAKNHRGSLYKTSMVC
jgi:hypothetical protein